MRKTLLLFVLLAATFVFAKDTIVLAEHSQMPVLIEC